MTNKLFDKRIAVVTGGRSGIGAAMCNRFLGHGAQVVSLDLYENVSKDQNIGIVEIVCDVTNQDSLKAAFDQIKKKFHKIDILCVNAGIVPAWSRSAETSFETWDRVMAINVIGAAMTLQNSIEILTKPGAAVLFTGSINSWKGDGNISSYVASKHAILGIIKSAAIDLGIDGIRVNGIAPGPIATDALLNRIKNRSSSDEKIFNETLEKLNSGTALKRMATVEEVVNLAEFLLSDLASGITGQLVTVDCGIL